MSTHQTAIPAPYEDDDNRMERIIKFTEGDDHMRPVKDRELIPGYQGGEGWSFPRIYVLSELEEDSGVGDRWLFSIDGFRCCDVELDPNGDGGTLLSFEGTANVQINGAVVMLCPSQPKDAMDRRDEVEAVTGIRPAPQVIRHYTPKEVAAMKQTSTDVDAFLAHPDIPEDLKEQVRWVGRGNPTSEADGASLKRLMLSKIRIEVERAERSQSQGQLH